jgi:cellobiose phosphorylase
MYRLIIESLLGLRLETDRLHVAPCLPAHWDGLKIHYRYRETVYHIAIAQMPADVDGTIGKTTVAVDGIEQSSPVIPLLDDRQEHTVDIAVFLHRSVDAED